jgi:hypothetical protein
MTCWLVDNELERICKEAGMIHFKALILRLFGETAEKQEKSQLGKPVSELRSKPRTSLK